MLTISLGLTAGHHGKEVKIYWETSGFFGPFNIQGLIPTYPEAKDITIPVSMFIISHPNGLVVYDTGNNVAIENGNCKIIGLLVFVTFETFSGLLFKCKSYA